MLKNLIKHSLRMFKRQRSSILINITGLSIGIACSLLIAFFIMHEVSYDRYNAKKERIFDVIFNFKIAGHEDIIPVTPPPLGPTFLREFPEVEDFLRIMRANTSRVEYKNKIFSEDHIIEADSSFFNFFSIHLLMGDPRNLLNAPRNVVLSESTAQRIFGDENPVGKILKFGKDTTLYTVTGIMADVPVNSHFEADIIISFMTDPLSNVTGWTSNTLSTYLLLKPNSSYKTVDEKIPYLVEKNMGPEIKEALNLTLSEFTAKGNKYSYYLENLTDLHLNTSIQPYLKATGDPKFLKILGSIAILILLIAAINFTNLSTAQASRRAREVAIKKVGGSSRWILITQFLGESIFMAFISTIVGFVIIMIILPYSNELLHANLKLDLLATWYLIPSLIIFAIGIGVLAGSYPSFILSSFSPYEVLKGSIKNNMKSGRLRSALVVFQFTISIFLIVGTLIMYRQIIYLLNKDAGFNKEQLLVLNTADALGDKETSFKDAIKTIPGVIKVTGSTCVPGHPNNTGGYLLEGKKDDPMLLMTNWVDYDFLETYGMTLTSGRSFNESYSSDKEACVLNEAAIKKYNINPEKFRIMSLLDSGKVEYYPIIGVVKDFVFESLRNQIGPFIFRLKPDRGSYGYLTVKLSGKNYSATIRQIEDKWKQSGSDEPFQYYFLDQDFEKLYIQEKQNAVMAVISAILAIFIAALGLFGLTSYTVEQRTKEIGVRKAMGSSIGGIYLEISKEIIMLVSISALIAWPVIYYYAGRWLENFYYKINLGAFSFIAGLAIALGIAIITISYRVIRAARVNPAQALKYE